VIFGELEAVVVAVVGIKAEVDIPKQVGMAMFRKQKALLFRRPGMISRTTLRKGANLTVLNKLPVLMSGTTSKMEFLPRLRVNHRKQRIRLRPFHHGVTRWKAALMALHILLSSGSRLKRLQLRNCHGPRLHGRYLVRHIPYLH
jgi:hypothetical protein